MASVLHTEGREFNPRSEYSHAIFFLPAPFIFNGFSAARRARACLRAQPLPASYAAGCVYAAAARKSPTKLEPTAVGHLELRIPNGPDSSHNPLQRIVNSEVNGWTSF